MADSDDEYDRKRRDKFRGERSSGDTGYRSERRDDRRGGLAAGRDDWPERNPFRGGGGAGGGGGRPRPDYRDYRSARDRYGSPGRDLPAAKRMRPDWGDDLRPSPRFGYDPYLMHAWNEHYASHSLHGPSLYGHQPHIPHSRDPLPLNADLQTQPAMLTLKQFLDTQDDSISDAEVLRKYSEYKLEYKRQQLNEFFVAHKDEEWFKNKYHPVDSVKRKDEQHSFLKRRVEVFKEVYDRDLVNEVLVDTAQTEQLLRLLDTIVIKLEGGTDEDLKVLDEKPKEIPPVVEKKAENDDDVIITSVEKNPKKDEVAEDDEYDSPHVVSPRVARAAAPGSDDENWDEDDDGNVKSAASAKKDASPAEQKKDKKTLKRKRKNSDSSSSSSSETDTTSSSSSEDDDETNNKNSSKYDLEKLEPEEDKRNEIASSPIKSVDEELKGPSSPKEDDEENEIDGDAEMEIKKEIDDDEKEDEGIHEVDENKNEDEEDDVDKISKDDEEKDDDKNRTKDDDGEIVEEEKETKVVVKDEPETIDLDKEKDIIKPRALHRTSSIFLRNLAPAITKAEIETLCKRFDGFLRVAIADPLVERRWYRRGWVTFSRDVNIKEICWNLNNTRLRDCEMGAIVNRDLSRRVRLVNGMTSHKAIVRSDIKLCAKITMNLDDKFKLWESGNVENETGNALDNESGGGDGGSAGNQNGNDKSNTYGFVSNNPVLQNITDFLIEEASAEEEELLGIAGDAKDENDGIERDVQLLTVLDKLILYLRVVHSVDFYNHCEYPYEDEMPNRCGIIHARGPPPTKITQTEIQDYIKNFENKMQSFLIKATKIEDDELQNLGCKDADTEVEKFILANTQELAKDKWLCPLSGKKFKGPEFIRKHIFNKHAEKVDEVRKEVEYFNNYLKDPKRPQLPEHPGNAAKRNNSESAGYRPPAFGAAFGPPYTAYAPPLMMPGRGGRGFGGAGARRDYPLGHYRRIIGYRDLDSPANFEY